MKILKIIVSGYKLFEDNFEIDFLNKARVNQTDKDDEIIELQENLYMPTTHVFTGKNASGKSSLLDLLEFVNDILYKGRVEYRKLDFRKATIELELYVLHHTSVYYYKGVLGKPKNNVLNETPYCDFLEEKLYSRKYSKSQGKKIVDLDYKIDNRFHSEVSDTSLLYRLTHHEHYMIHAHRWINPAKISIVFELFDPFDIGSSLMRQIIQLFDDSILSLNYDHETKLYRIDMKGLGLKYYSESEVENLFSEGTKKGLILFALAITTLKLGGTLVIDEIENSFHKNLVENIIMIFNDKRINKNRANLIFTTHYVEILDIFRRRDNIFIMSKDPFIRMHNLYDDYDDRGDLTKSNQFNNNTFKTLINYDQLMSLKKMLMDEVFNFTRG